MKKIDRFDKYMNFKGLNDNKVTTQVGLSVGLLGKSRQENRDLSEKAIEKILNFYIDLNRVWLLTGEGEMLNESAKAATEQAAMSTTTYTQPQPSTSLVTVKPRPLILEDIAKKPNFDVYEYVKNTRIANTSYIGINILQSYDLCYRVTQDALAPDFKPNDIIALSAIPREATIVSGAVFVVDTYSVGFLLRYVYDRGDYYEMKVTNPTSMFETFMLPKSDVIRLYRVVGLFRIGL